MKERKLTLLPNLQFIYELHMARLEALTLTGGSSVADDFRSFIANGKTDAELVKRCSAYVGAIDGKPTDYARLTKKNITRAFNQYITHWFYPYKGKFHPQMVRGLANIMGLKSGETLLDPFSGSGTTIVEGALLGLKTIGYDISPLCVLIGKVKANAIHHLKKIVPEEEKFSLLREAPTTWNEDIANKLSDPVLSVDLLAHMIARESQKGSGL